MFFEVCLLKGRVSFLYCFLSLSLYLPLSIYIYIYIYIFFFFFKFSSYNVWKHVLYHILISRHPGVITQFSVAQGGTATPGATKQLLPPDRVLRESYIYNIYIYIYIYIYMYIYMPDPLNAEDYIGRLSSFSECSLWFKKKKKKKKTRLLSAVDVITRLQ